MTAKHLEGDRSRKSLSFGPDDGGMFLKNDRSDETSAILEFSVELVMISDAGMLVQAGEKAGERHPSPLSGSENSLYSRLVTNGKRLVAIINVYAVEKKSSLLFPHAGRFNCPTSKHNHLLQHARFYN